MKNVKLFEDFSEEKDTVFDDYPLLGKAIEYLKENGYNITPFKNPEGGLKIHIWEGEWSAGAGEYYYINPIDHKDWAPKK